MPEHDTQYECDAVDKCTDAADGRGERGEAPTVRERGEHVVTLSAQTGDRLSLNERNGGLACPPQRRGGQRAFRGVSVRPTGSTVLRRRRRRGSGGGRDRTGRRIAFAGMRYWSATDGAEPLESAAHVGTWLSRFRGVVVPDGDLHAVVLAGAVTACGVPVEGLSLLPEMDFEQPPPAASRCHRSLAAIR
jgi:hypothetical protein